MSTTATSKLLDLIGQLKVVTLIVGIIDIGLTASAYFNYSSEEYFLAIVCIAFIFSFIFVLAIVFGLIPVTDLWKKIDMIYHGVIAILLSIGILCMLISMIKNRDDSHSGSNGSWIAKRCFAVIFALGNTVIYGYIAYGIYQAPEV